MVLDESKAWKILQNYTKDCLKIDSQSLLAVYTIGSLAGGYYLPGQSDIDVILIVKNSSQDTWGTNMRPSNALKNLNLRYFENYKIPIDFSPFPLEENELFPPYPPKRKLTSAITQLKIQGRCIYGNFPIEFVPIPTVIDILKDTKIWEQEWEEFLSHKYVEQIATVTFINLIIRYLRLFLHIKVGVIEFNKTQIIPCYLKNNPPFVDKRVLNWTQTYFVSGKYPKMRDALIKQYAMKLRKQMIAYLGILL